MKNKNHIKEIIKEAEKTWSFHNSHNVMTAQPKGVMAVNEARKLFNKLVEVMNEKQKSY